MAWHEVADQRIWGHGPVKAVMVSGWLGTAADWDACLASLDPARVSVFPVDIRGYGSRKNIPGLYTFEEAAADILAAMDRLEWGEVVLVGHSMGAMLIQRVLLLERDRVSKLIGIAPVPACGARMPADRFASFAYAITDRVARASIVHASTGKRLSSRWCEGIADQSCDRSLSEAAEAYLAQWAVGGFEEQLESCPPATLFVGEHDPTLTAERMLSTWGLWYPALEVETVPNAGHYPILETPAYMGSRLAAALI